MVADEIARRTTQQDGITVKKVSAGGWQLLHEIEGFDRLIVVDAYFTCETTPGQVRIHHRENQIPTREVDAASAHLLTIPDAVALSEKCGYHTPTLVAMVTIDVGDNCLIFGTGLSPQVATAVPKAADAVLELLETA